MKRNSLFPRAPTDHRIDLHSLQVIRQGDQSYPKHAQQKSSTDRPFRFYDEGLLDDFPTWRRYASLEKLGGRPMFQMREKLHPLADTSGFTKIAEAMSSPILIRSAISCLWDGDRAPDIFVITGQRVDLIRNQGLSERGEFDEPTRLQLPATMGGFYGVAPVGRMIVVQTEPDLLEVVAATHPTCRFPGSLHGREQNSN